MTLQLRAINKRFGERQVLHQLDLDVANGECVALLGASGCGKSTALRLIAGLDHPDQGSIRINDAEMVDVPAERRRVGMVFQSYALFPHLNVWENLELGLRMRGGSAGARDERIRSVLEVLQLSGQARQRPSQLSGGQRQRVALGRAMVRKPAAFLMDEPLSNLDAALRVHMRSELAELHRSLATTFIYVTHDQSEALTMSDRMAVMMGGEILQLGTPDEIYHDPRDLRVAQFIGTPQINVFDAAISGGQGVTVNGVPLAAEVSGGGDLAFVAVRPEHLTLLPADGAGAGQPLTVTLKENLGADFFIHGHIGDGAAPVIVRATPAEAADVAIGSVCALAPLNAAEVMAFGRDHARLDLVMTGAPAAVLERV